MARSERCFWEKTQQLFLGIYQKQLARIWRRIPHSARNRQVMRTFGRHVDRVTHRSANRSQHFATFFLRNRPELELLRRLVERLPPQGSLDITIVACSKGAEVYSKAWVIRSARPDISLQIRAIDISPEIISFARHGIYSLSFSDETDSTSADAVRQKVDISQIPSSDRESWILRGVSREEIESIFDINGDKLSVKPWLREGITWLVSDANDPGLLASIGPQDMVVANNFLCHMTPSAAEKCLVNIGRLVKPGGFLFVAGIDLGVRTKVARLQGWAPVTELIREIHDGDDALRGGWPLQYWGVEPFDSKRAHWQLRYAAVFQVGAALSEKPENALQRP